MVALTYSFQGDPLARYSGTTFHNEVITGWFTVECPYPYDILACSDLGWHNYTDRITDFLFSVGSVTVSPVDQFFFRLEILDDAFLYNWVIHISNDDIFIGLGGEDHFQIARDETGYSGNEQYKPFVLVPTSVIEPSALSLLCIGLLLLVIISWGIRSKARIQGGLN